jgi:hypothetical protein
MKPLLVISVATLTHLYFGTAAYSADRPARAGSPPFSGRTLATEALRISGNKDKDPFEQSAASPIKGRHFVVDVPLPQQGRGSGLNFDRGGWSYDAQERKLSFYVRASIFRTPPDVPQRDVTEAYLYGFNFAGSTKATGHYIGQNAFGARARVSSFSDATVAIVDYPPPAPDIRHLERGVFRGSVAIEPGRARTLAPLLKLRIEGDIASFDDGRSVACGSDYDSATIRDPVSHSRHFCLVAARVSKVSVVGPGLDDPGVVDLSN